MLEARDTRWDHETGERLFVAAARLPESLRSLLPHPAVAQSTVCAAVSTGAWPALDVEIVLRWAQDPTRILTGAVPVTDRLRYLTDQYVVRSAIMLSSLLRHLQRADQPSASDDDDTIRDVAVTIPELASAPAEQVLDPVTYAVAAEPLSVGWRCLAHNYTPQPALTVRVLPLESDLLEDVGPDFVSCMVEGEVLLVPADAAARSHRLGNLRKTAENAGVSVFAAPDYTTSMDVVIAARLDRSRMSRQ